MLFKSFTGCLCTSILCTVLAFQSESHASELNLQISITQDPTPAGDITYSVAVNQLSSVSPIARFYSPGSATPSDFFWSQSASTGEELQDLLTGVWTVEVSDSFGSLDTTTYSFEIGIFDAADLSVHTGHAILSPLTGSVFDSGEVFQVNWTQGTRNETDPSSILGGIVHSNLVSGNTLEWLSTSPDSLTLEMVGQVAEGNADFSFDLQVYYPLDITGIIPVSTPAYVGGVPPTATSNINLAGTVRTPRINLTIIPEPATLALLTLCGLATLSRQRQ